MRRVLCLLAQNGSALLRDASPDKMKRFIGE
jgi:hypothetical protein